MASLLTTKTILEACEKSGVALRTGKRWLTLPAVKQVIREAQSDALATVTRLATVGALDAINCLIDIIKSDAHPAVRVSAARAILDSMTRLTDLLDHEERLAALETLQNEH